MKNTKLSITDELIFILSNLVNGVVGFDIGNSFVEELKISKRYDGKEIVYKYASSIEKTLGKKRAFETLRTVGSDLATSLIKENGSEKWKSILENSLRIFGFAQKIELKKDNAFICNCVFYDILQKDGLEPIEHPVCWVGWGFIEGFMIEFKKVDSIKWSYRDDENKRCNFVFIRDESK